MAPNEIAECPFCWERMQQEDRDGSTWLICPNGCPTELEIIAERAPLQRATGSGK
ncbi:MAG: hypothetical protein M3O35_09140 [Acidobacteriota bacterium]|nr:hypothetical protein [Acidobacteriota bacterium]